MSKKKKKKAFVHDGDSPAAGIEGGKAVSVDKEAISSRGWKTIGGGLVILLLGFGTLSLTDPEGRNWASTLSPFLILGAYAVIALGIFLPENDLEQASEAGMPVEPPKTTG